MIKVAAARLGRTGRWALAIAVLAAVCLMVWLTSLVSALLLPSGGADSAKADEKQRLAELQENYKQQIAQFNGRTVFYVPAKPGPPPEPEKTPEDKDKPSPLPSSYGGPAVIAMVNDVVWFADGTRVKVGESSGDVKIVKLNAPWDATVLWKGAEFKVKFFEKDAVVLAKGKSAESALSTPPSPPPSAADSGKPDAGKEKSKTTEAAKAPDKPGDKPTDKPTDKPSDKPGSKPGEKPGEKPAQPPPSKPGEAPPDQDSPPPPPGEGGPPPPPNQPEPKL